MLFRFLAPDLDATRSEVVLPADEAHHLARVLRLETGDEVVVFDGRGLERRGRVASAARGAVSVTLVGTAEAARPPVVALTVVQSVLKGAAMDDVVRDCTMVGAASIVPVLTARTSVKVSMLPAAHERWRRIALASAKQCARAALPRIDEPVPYARWLRSGAGSGALLLVEPSVAPAGALTIRQLATRPAPAAATLVVGPEGGWTEGEMRAALEAGCVPLTLGRLILRAAAVPLVGAGALLGIWDEGSPPASSSQRPGSDS